MMWLLATPRVSGIFNVGTGKARSFKDLMLAAYAALGTTPNIDYIDMPEQIRGSYQYFTRERRSIGCAAPATTAASPRWKMRSRTT